MEKSKIDRHNDLIVFKLSFKAATELHEKSKSFVSKLSDSEAEAAETQVWISFALQFGYIDNLEYLYFNDLYDNILSKLVIMINNPNKWTL